MDDPLHKPSKLYSGKLGKWPQQSRRAINACEAYKVLCEAHKVLCEA